MVGWAPVEQCQCCAAFDTFLLLFLQYLGVRKLEAFFATLVAVMAISFGVIAFKADLPAKEVVLGVVVPRFKCAARAVPCTQSHRDARGQCKRVPQGCSEGMSQDRRA